MALGRRGGQPIYQRSDAIVLRDDNLCNGHLSVTLREYLQAESIDRVKHLAATGQSLGPISNRNYLDVVKVCLCFKPDYKP